MKKNELVITWCYKDILNLHGDRGNLMALKKVGELLGLKVTIKKIDHYQDPIDFKHTDILFFNPGELRVVPSIIEALTKQKEALDNYIKSNKFLIVIGSTGAVFSKKLIRNDQIISGLGYLDMECHERETIYGDDLLFSIKNMEINGSQIQMMDTIVNKDIRLGTITYGHGNCGKQDEGAKYKNLIFTNCLGPVFVKNPWYAEKIIKEAMKIKGVNIKTKIQKQQYEIEMNSLKCIKEFIHKKIEKKKEK